MKNTMINTMIINQLNEVVDSIASRNNSGGNIPSSLSKKVLNEQFEIYLYLGIT